MVSSFTCMEKNRPWEWPTTPLASRSSNGRSERTNGGTLNSAGRDPRLLLAKPSLHQQFSPSEVLIIDDEESNAAHGDGEADMPWPEEQVSGRDNTHKIQVESRNDDQTADSASGVDLIDTKSQRDHDLTSQTSILRLNSLLSIMKERQMSVIAKRLWLQEERLALRASRNMTVDLVAKLMTSLNAFFATQNSPEVQKLKSEYEKFREAGDGYLPKEDDYNQQEDSINQQEWELKELEMKVHRKIDRHCRMMGAEDGSQSDDIDVLSTDSESTVSQQPTYPPLFSEFLSRLGDVDLVRDQLMELRSERAFLVEQQRLLAKAGRQLGDSSLDFLAKFDTRHEELQRQIGDLEVDVDRLRDAWNSEHSASRETSKAANEEVISLEESPLPEPDPLLVDQVSSLLDLPTSPTQELPTKPKESLSPRIFPLYEDLRKRDPIGTLNHINEWFLWRLRRSRLEIKRYKSDPNLDKLRNNEAFLSELILKYWFHDSATGLFSDQGQIMIPKSATINSGRNIGRDGLSHSGSTARSDSDVYAMRRLTLLFRGNSSQPLQQSTSLRENQRRRFSAPGTSALASS